jgi:RimJ/RimL family protein N-acetyltransferase
MPPASSDWQVTPDAADDQVYSVLAQDLVWNSFGLADLEPPLRAYSQFAVATQENGPERALCLILRHPIIGDVLSPFGADDGVAAILRNVVLPDRPLIQAQQRHIPLLQRHYRPAAVSAWRSMLRMAVSATSWQPIPTAASAPPVVRLAPPDVPALSDLYSRHPESAFSAELFSEGLYFGIRAGDHFIAVGGTHALVPAHGVAVLGNIYTTPESRGRGYATAITAALVAALLDQGFSAVVLNVFADNSPAIHVYERLGFQTHHHLLTGPAVLVQQPGQSKGA